MFISVLELFKIGIGPSSSHTLGPMIAANGFTRLISGLDSSKLTIKGVRVRCILRGSLAFTGKGHATDHAVSLGLHGYLPSDLVNENVSELLEQIWKNHHIYINQEIKVLFDPNIDIVFDETNFFISSDKNDISNLVIEQLTLEKETYLIIPKEDLF